MNWNIGLAFQQPGRSLAQLRRYYVPIGAIVTASIILSFSLFAFSGMSNMSVPVIPLVNVDSSTNPTLIWNYTTGGAVGTYRTINGQVAWSPVVNDGIVYAGSSNGNVYALNATNGVQLWNSSGGPPAVANGVVYAGTGYSVDALNATSGAQLWSNSPLTNIPVDYSSLAVVGEVVYTSTTTLAGFLFALNAKTGNELWSFTTDPSYFQVWSPPDVVNGVVYVGSTAFFNSISPANGVYALNAKSGAQLWNYSSGYSVEASPVVVGGVVYFANYDGTFYALNAKNGIQLWNYTTSGPGPVYSSPAVVNGVVYAGSDDGNVYALNATSGAKLWSYTTGNGTLSSPTVVRGVVYVGSSDDNIYALSATNGVKLWNYTTSGSVGSPVVVNGVLYVGGGDNVYALRVSSSSPVPESSNTLRLVLLGTVIVVVIIIVSLIIFTRHRKTANLKNDICLKV